MRYFLLPMPSILEGVMQEYRRHLQLKGNHPRQWQVLQASGKIRWPCFHDGIPWMIVDGEHSHATLTRLVPISCISRWRPVAWSIITRRPLRCGKPPLPRLRNARARHERGRHASVVHRNATSLCPMPTLRLRSRSSILLMQAVESRVADDVYVCFKKYVSLPK